MHILPKSFFAAVLAACCGSAPAGQGDAHTHGAARLNLAVDGETVTLALESPLDSLLGFEHLPRGEKQKAAVRDMAAKLNRPEALFGLSAAAQCAPDGVELSSPVLESAPRQAANGHLDLDGRYRFRCAHPQALREVEVRLFDAFPRLRRLDVQAATPRGQSAARLTPAQRRIAW